MTDRLEDVRAVIEPLLKLLDMELVDVETVGSGRASTLRITVDREGGVDLDAIAVATEAISAALDRLDPIMGSYALEVSSPGIERPLRRPDDFARHVGSKVSVKTHAQADGAAPPRRRSLRPTTRVSPSRMSRERHEPSHSKRRCKSGRSLTGERFPRVSFRRAPFRRAPFRRVPRGQRRQVVLARASKRGQDDELRPHGGATHSRARRVSRWTHFSKRLPTPWSPPTSGCRRRRKRLSSRLTRIPARSKSLPRSWTRTDT